MPCTQVVEADVAVDGLPRLIIRLPVYYLLQNISPTKVTYISCLIGGTFDNFIRGFHKNQFIVEGGPQLKFHITFVFFPSVI